MQSLTASIENDADNGPRDRGPERMCVVTRAVRPVGDLIRFVTDPDGAVVPDLKQKLPGRGVWVTATADAVDKAAARNAFARSLKKPVKASADLAATTDRLLEQSALDALAIAHKAGLVQAGFTRVEKALASGQVAAVLHAADASPDGVRKLQAVMRRLPADSGPVSVGAFNSAQLDLALGRSNVIHAALLAGPASEAFLARCRRLAAFRGNAPAREIAIPCG